MADTPVAPARSVEPAGPDQSSVRAGGFSERTLARLFIAPSIILMALVALFPVVYAFILSLNEYTRRQHVGFAGLQNYADALTDGRFWESLRFTLVFTVTSVGAEFLIGLGFALIMNQAFRGRGITRAAILIPWVIPTVIAAQMWFFMFNVTPGFINNVFGLGNFNWLGQQGWATFAVIFADVWKTSPFVALLLLAGLQTIPGDLYESAMTDGANALQRLWYITLPLLRPAILVALLFRTVEALRVYDLPQVMTGGAFNTESLSILVQQYVVRTPNPGYGAALSTLSFVIILGVGLVFVSMLGRQLVIGRTTER
ncbi:sugar ABC transporter permease [Phytoactinopolyspora alkaliphila]|uniref:Sugar ABC transporter permease n=1 Tax=Phytoactinopolyspora alkaliphila TaxID=1783498 RepID=A0A6N9YRG3_9ACTN|nr:sugar ABC transporter permease [Phytoactinopolyspora alkaliphila]NED97572.1 sugar ABC transporter permease [Phytoactinopolyspora alkaliphila]